MILSEAARSVWAKSVDGAGGWLPLWQHMDDSADIAVGLFGGWLAPSVVGLFGEEFGGDVEAARAAVVFLAGVHDLGKATPAFAVQDVVLAQRMRDAGLYMPMSVADRYRVHHSMASHHLLVQWLVERGWSRIAARAWGVVLGGHHGVPPDTVAENAGAPRGNSALYGDGLWKNVQRELLERMAVRTGAAKWLDAWRGTALSARFQVLATAVVIVSDWIASNKELLPFHRDQLPSVSDGSDRAGRALAALSLPVPWRVGPVPEDVAALFAARFRFPSGARPRPVQEAACRVASDMPGPGLVIIEAPMGEGKTEAALAAAEVLAARWGAGGLLVALPTQATSDAMFDRVVEWLDALGSNDQQVGGSIMLSHGKARFNRLFQGLVRAGRFAEIGRDEEGRHGESRHRVVAHAWMSGRKKAQLANFVVGTIDQLLFAGLKSRHLMLRHLGLAGKVVVIDEIHAYDAYMNSYLTKVLTWLGAYRVPVVALSATLPADRRRALVEAYRRGRDERTGIGDLAVLDGEAGYPSVTWTAENEVRVQQVESSGRRTSVAVETLADDLDRMVEVLRDALSDGGAALVVHNTVRRVLATAHRLEKEFPGEVTVTHSRFIVADRMRHDTALLDSFGAPERALRRPQRHIVVASQVVEQSLDIDFDLLITDLAPVDLVLQRVGRLHRHQRGKDQDQRPRKVRRARAYVTGVDFDQSPPELEVGAARYVYDAHSLLRAAAVLQPCFGGSITLPDDIPGLVRQAYGAEDIGPEAWREAMDEARNQWRERTGSQAEKAELFQITKPTRHGKAIVGWVSAGVGEIEDAAAGQGQVRDGAPSLEALLIYRDASGAWHTPSWLGEGRGGRHVSCEVTPPDELAEVMASCVLRLPLTFSNADAEDELWAATPDAWEESPLIYRIPVLVVDGDGWGQINQRRIRYTPEKGLEVFDTAE